MADSNKPVLGDVEAALKERVAFLRGLGGGRVAPIVDKTNSEEAPKRVLTAVQDKRFTHSVETIKDILVAKQDGRLAQLAQNNPRQYQTIVLRFGLDSADRQSGYRTLEEVAQLMGVTRQRSHQLEQKGLEALRGGIEKQLVVEPALSSSTPSVEPKPVLVKGNDSFVATIKTVATYYSVQESDLLGEARGNQNIAAARQIVMYLLWKVLRLSCPKIGKGLHRDHSTVMHGCSNIANRRLGNWRLNQELEEFEHLLAPFAPVPQPSVITVASKLATPTPKRKPRKQGAKKQAKKLAQPTPRSKKEVAMPLLPKIKAIEAQFTQAIVQVVKQILQHQIKKVLA